MSITSATLTATAGLGAVARGTDIVASNIANAATDGYARRELRTSAQIHGGGINIDGVSRLVNTGILAEYRIATAQSGHAARISDFHSAIESTIGITGNAASLSDHIADFESALISASARPDDDIRLAKVLTTAADLVGAINHFGGTAENQRNDAHSTILRDVAQLNSGLAQVAHLNRAIVTEAAIGRDTSALMDARQREIDAVAQIIPLREALRDNGQVSLFTTNGAALLDGFKPVSIEFPASPTPQPGMSAAAGDLSFLVIDGRPLTASQMDLYSGGTLDASFKIRDHLAPEAQLQADRLAADLAASFGNGGPDTSISSGSPGLFTNTDLNVTLPPENGLAQRLTLNAAVDPTQGGETWRLQNGIYAATLGEPGDSTIFEGMIAALHELQASPQTPNGAGRSLIDIAANLTGSLSTNRVRADQALAGRAAHDKALLHSLAAEGVDTDHELERLLALEQAYAANARVIKAADSMLDAILGI